MAYLYRHIRLDTNQVFYIGIGSDSDYKRAYSKFNRNYLWNNLIKKTEYEVEIVIENDSYEFIKEKEIEFIKLYGRKDLKTGFLVNMTDGGQGRLSSSFSESEKEKRKNYPRGEKHHSYGIPLSESHKAAIGNKLKGRKRPEISKMQTGKKMPESSRRFGEKNPFYGKKHSNETKAKMSKIHKGMLLGDKHPMYGKENKRFSEYNKSIAKEDRYWFGRTLTDEHKANLRKANVGKKRSEETCENNRRAQLLRFKTQKHNLCKLVLNLENGVFYESAKEAALVHGYKKTTLIGILNGRSKTKINLIYA